MIVVQILFWVSIALVLAQVGLVARFVAALLRGGRGARGGPYCPKTAVVLCLRGADPFLKKCISALLCQDYPRYDVKIVVDRREDPAWQIVQAAVAECGAANVEAQPLLERRQTCSLKCSSLVQAIRGLDPSYEVVALLDADTIPHRRWLAELVTPLASERVGVSTGNRWYMSPDVSWPSLVRYLWNVGAVVQMFWYHIPWGGTLAVKTGALARSGLLERWEHAFCEDTMLYRAMRRAGLQVAFVPSLMMINREGTSLASCFGWVSRQLLTARLYHPYWPLVLLHGMGTSAFLLVLAGVCVAAVCGGWWPAAVWSGAALLAYLAAMPLLVLPMEWAVRRIARTRGEPTAWLGLGGTVRLWPGVVVTQAVYCGAMAWALVVREVGWRGVAYRVAGPWQISLLRDPPYPGSTDDDALRSL
ncbi:MAG: glycosyltransferase family 2 protein [Thermoguttaceae bacterium]|jgi:GT2 family glycosyltransferase